MTSDGFTSRKSGRVRQLLPCILLECLRNDVNNNNAHVHAREPAPPPPCAHVFFLGDARNGRSLQSNVDNRPRTTTSNNSNACLRVVINCSNTCWAVKFRVRQKNFIPPICVTTWHQQTVNLVSACIKRDSKTRRISDLCQIWSNFSIEQDVKGLVGVGVWGLWRFWGFMRVKPVGVCVCVGGEEEVVRSGWGGRREEVERRWEVRGWGGWR